MSDETKAMLGCLGVIVVLLAAYVLNGIALRMLWEWFAVAQFNLPPLSIAHAIGIGVLISYLTKYTPIGQNDKASFTEALMAAIVRPVAALGTGYIIRLFL